MINSLNKRRISTGNYYAALLTILWEAIVQMASRKLCNGILLLQDNAFAPKTRVALQTIRDLGLELLKQPLFHQIWIPLAIILLTNWKILNVRAMQQHGLQSKSNRSFEISRSVVGSLQ